MSFTPICHKYLVQRATGCFSPIELYYTYSHSSLSLPPFPTPFLSLPFSPLPLGQVLVVPSHVIITWRSESSNIKLRIFPSSPLYSFPKSSSCYLKEHPSHFSRLT